MSITINQQYRQFVQFAERQANPTRSEAIARVTGREDALAGRTIIASNTDRVRGVFNWGKRSDDEETKNNETRTLFKKAVVLPHTQDMLKEYMSPEEAWHFDEEGIFDNLIRDADRTFYTINGEAMNRDPKVVKIFKEKIQSVKHRKALSCFFSQMSMSTFNELSGRKILADVPSAKMFAGLDNSNYQHEMDGCELRMPKILLDISDDGRHATMTLENEGGLLFAKDGDIGFFCMPIGTFAWRQEIVFDLSSEEAVITDTHVRQDLTIYNH